jgi:hypothetical protein
MDKTWVTYLPNQSVINLDTQLETGDSADSFLGLLVEPFEMARTNNDYYNFWSINKVEQNMDFLIQYLESLQYAIPDLTLVTDRDQSYIDTLVGINRIENNLEAVRQAFATPPGYLGSKSWVIGQGFDSSDANRLETNIRLLLETAYAAKTSFRYCGVTIAGQGGLPQ